MDRVLVPYCPKGLDKIHLFDDITGAMANETAIRASFMKHHTSLTGSEKFDFEEFQASQANQNSLDYKVISF